MSRPGTRLTPGLRRGRTAKVAGLGLAVTVAATGVAGVPAAAAGPAPRAFSGGYVAMGDSYTSGPGIATQRGDSGLCTRSDRNYPSLVAAAISPTSFKDVSCSGAVTSGITGSSGQINAIDASTRLVTIGIGGNDAGLIGAGVTCVILSLFNSTGSPCKDLYQGGTADDRLIKSIDDAQPAIRSTLLAVKQRAPQARVILVGYPDLVPTDATRCAPGVDRPLATGDIPWLYGINRYVNQTWARTAAAAGVEYVDTFTPGHGHDACQAVGTRWIEGVTNVTNGGPIHPNGTGMQAFANLVVAKLG
jgi:lysophospholipase L1-like esterase